MKEIMEQITLEQIAELLEVKTVTARLYHNQATRRRREGNPAKRDMPEPTIFIGRSPRWDKKVIEEWMSTVRRKKD
jgi:hypothetical protein